MTHDDVDDDDDDDDGDDLNGTHFAAQVAASWALALFQTEVGRIPAGVSIFPSGDGIYIYIYIYLTR